MTQLIFMPQQFGGLGLTALSSVQLIAALSLQSEMMKLPHIHNMATIIENKRIEAFFSFRYQINKRQPTTIPGFLYPNRVFQHEAQEYYDYETSSSASSSLSPGSSSSSSSSNDIHNSSSSSSVQLFNNLPDMPSIFKSKGIWYSTEGTAGYLNHFDVFEPITTLHDLLERDANTITNDTKRSISFAQHDLWISQMEQVYNRLLDQKQKKNESQYFTLRANSIDATSAAWLRAIPYSNYQKMNDEEFCRSLHYRLGSPDKTIEFIKQLPRDCFKSHRKFYEETKENTVNDVDDETVLCSSSSSSSSSSHNPPHPQLACPLCGNRLGRYHAANCQVTGPLRSARHNLIKRLLASTLNQLPSALVVVEDYASGGEDSSGRKRVPDITVTIPDITREPTELERKYLGNAGHGQGIISFSIDLTITDIHSRSNAAEHRAGRFAIAAERMKKKAYKEYNKDPRNRIKVLPFAISSVGELGPIAQDIIKFINELAKRNNMVINTDTLKEQIDLLLESSRNEMEKTFLEQVQRRSQDALHSKKHTQDSLELNPILVEGIEQSKLNRVPAFWVRQLENTTKFLNDCSVHNLSNQRAQELHQRLFNWIPVNESKDNDGTDKPKYIAPGQMQVPNTSLLKVPERQAHKSPPPGRKKKKRKRGMKDTEDSDSSLTSPEFPLLNGRSTTQLVLTPSTSTVVQTSSHRTPTLPLSRCPTLVLNPVVAEPEQTKEEDKSSKTNPIASLSSPKDNGQLPTTTSALQPSSLVVLSRDAVRTPTIPVTSSLLQPLTGTSLNPVKGTTVRVEDQNKQAVPESSSFLSSTSLLSTSPNNQIKQ